MEKRLLFFMLVSLFLIFSLSPLVSASSDGESLNKFEAWLKSMGLGALVSGGDQLGESCYIYSFSDSCAFGSYCSGILNVCVAGGEDFEDPISSPRGVGQSCGGVNQHCISGLQCVGGTCEFKDFQSTTNDNCQLSGVPLLHDAFRCFNDAKVTCTDGNLDFDFEDSGCGGDSDPSFFDKIKNFFSSSKEKIKNFFTNPFGDNEGISGFLNQIKWILILVVILAVLFGGWKGLRFLGVF